LQDIFYDKMLADDRVNFFFDGIDMEKQHAHQVGNSSHPPSIPEKLSSYKTPQDLQTATPAIISL